MNTEPIPNNTLVSGSLYTTTVQGKVFDLITAHAHLSNLANYTSAKSGLHGVHRRDSTRLVLCCHTDGQKVEVGGSRVKLDERKCDFLVTARMCDDTKLNAKINSCTLTHSCQSADRLSAPNATSSRRGNPKLPVLQAANTPVLTNFVAAPASRKHTRDAITLMNNVESENLLRITEHLYVRNRMHNYSLCVLHAARNCKFPETNAARAAVVSYARAPTVEAADYYEREMEKTLHISRAVIQKLKDRHAEFSTIDLMSRGVLTNYGQVTSNASEQSNHKDAAFRHLPIVSQLMSFLISLSSDITQRLAEAKQLQQDGEQVTPFALQGTREFHLWARERQWKASYVQLTAELEMEFLVYNGHHTNFKVILNADQVASKPWYERVVCRCEYTLALGRPCLHASFVLCELPSILEKKRLNRDYMQIFHYKMSIWYAPVFHVTQYVLQYTTQVVIPECDDLSNTAYRLFPPVVKPRKGRKKARLTKRRKTNASAAATSSSCRRSVLNHNDASDDDDDASDEKASGEEVEGSSEDGGNAADGEADSDVEVLSRHTTSHYNIGAYIMPPLLGTQEDALPVKPKPVLHCGWCGSTEHNRRVCDKKDIAYLYKLHNLFAVVQSAQPLPENILWQLSSDRAIARVRDVASNSNNSSVTSATEEHIDGAQAAQTTTAVATIDDAVSSSSNLTASAAIDFQTQQLLPSGECAVQYTDADDYDAKHFRCLPCVLSVPNILGIGDLPKACENCAADKDGFNVLVLPAPSTVEDILVEMGVWNGSHYDKFMFDENIVTSIECHGGVGFSECYGMNINACNEEVPPFYDEYARKVGRWWYWKGGDM